MVMADTSGSMSGRPLATSVGLATYFAERNQGPYKNKFIVFAGEPEFVEIKGTNLMEKISCIPEINAQNTNIEKAFELILSTAINNNLVQEDLPKALIIISDMEFDRATDKNRDYWYDNSNTDRNIAIHNKLMADLRAKFNQYGYDLPKIIFISIFNKLHEWHCVFSCFPTRNS